MLFLVLNSYLDIIFGVLKKIDISRFANADEIRLGNLGPVVFFTNFKLTTSSGKHSEVISHAHIVSLM